MRTDIAVVGSGLAALVAARTLQKAGRRPMLVWPGLSSLYFVYAAVDVLGYADAGATHPIEQPGAAVAQLITDHPEHPYARAGTDALSGGVGVLLDWLQEAGLRWQGSLAANLLLPTAIGTPKPSCLVPQSMAPGDLRRQEPIVFCGFTGYQDFIPELAASNLARSWSRGTDTVQSLRVPVPGFDQGRHFTSIDLARRFEDESFRREVATRIRRELPGDGIRVGIPAVLGFTHVGEVHARFETEVGHPVFEIPTLPPSVLGLRLFEGLRKHLQASGVEILWAAPAHAAEVIDGRCRHILIKSANRDQPVEARAYVLALEDVADGALRAGVHTLVDPFFHRVVARSELPADRTDESLFGAQPFAQAGYRVSDRLQPLGDDGQPLAENVFVAGGAIAGGDPTATKSRGGLAVATGYRAAQEAMVA